MADDPLEALARQGRAAQSREHEEYEDALRERRAEVAAHRDERLNAALGGGYRSVIMAGPIWALATLGGIAWIRGGATILGIAAMVVGGLVGFVVFALTQHSAVEKERRQLEQLPFQFVLERYLDELTKAHMTAMVDVWITFQAQVPEQARATIRDALVGAAGTGAASFTNDGSRLNVRSPLLSGYHHQPGSESEGRYHCRLRHQWFKQLLTRGVLTLHTQYTIRSLDVTIQG